MLATSRRLSVAEDVAQLKRLMGVAELVKYGIQMNSLYIYRTTLKGGFNRKKILPVQNPNGELSWSKPHGGMWMATIDESGMDSWNELLGSDSDMLQGTSSTDMKFNDNARVMFINSREDYLQALEQYPYYQTVEVDESLATLITGGRMASYWTVNNDLTPKRMLNYELIAQDFDAIMLSYEGLYDCGRGDYFENVMGTDMSLYAWDIESCYVLNGHAVEVTSHE
jgi:hypothetical protein